VTVCRGQARARLAESGAALVIALAGVALVLDGAARNTRSRDDLSDRAVWGAAPRLSRPQNPQRQRAAGAPELMAQSMTHDNEKRRLPGDKG